MKQTVLGYFDTLEAAQRAADRLQDDGVAPGGIRVDRRDDAHAASALAAVVTVHTDSEEEALHISKALRYAGARSVDDPNIEYETSSSLNPYETPQEHVIKNDYDPHSYSAAPDGEAEGGETPQTPSEIMQEQKRKADALRRQIDQNLGLH